MQISLRVLWTLIGAISFSFIVVWIIVSMNTLYDSVISFEMNFFYLSLIYGAICIFPPVILRIRRQSIDILGLDLISGALFFCCFGIEPLFSSLGIIRSRATGSQLDIRSLEYLCAFVSLYWVGFYSSIHLFRKSDYFSRIISRKESTESEILAFSPNVLIGVSIFAFLLALIWLGGLDSLFWSESLRGEGQWSVGAEKYFIISHNLIATAIDILAGISYAKSRSKSLYVVPALHIIENLAKLSRASFIPILLFAVGVHLGGKRIKQRVWLSLFACAICMGILTMQARALARNTGLFAFTEGVKTFVVEQEVDMTNSEMFVGSMSRYPTFREVISISYINQAPFEGFLKWAGSVSPLPTFITGFNRRRVNLATPGSNTGDPFPSVSELHFFMGSYALLFALIMGIWFGLLQLATTGFGERQFKPRWEFVLLYASSLFGLLRSFHGITRDATRWVLYCLLFIVLIKIFSKIKKKLMKSA